MKKQTNSRVRHSIKRKLALLLVILIIIPILGLGYISFSNAESILSENLKDNSTVLVQKLNSNVDTYLTGFEQSLEMFSNNLNVTEIIYMPENDNEHLYDILENYQKANPDVLSIYMGTVNKKLYEYPITDTTYDTTYDPTSRPWYQDAIKANKMIWTEPYIDVSTGKLVISVAKPVNSSKGELAGVIAIDITLDKISNQIITTKIGDSGQAFFMDKKGIVLGHPDKALNGSEYPEKKLIEKAQTEKSGLVEFKQNSETKMGIYEVNDKLNWIIVGVMSSSEIDNDLKVILRVTLLAGLAFAAIAAIIGIVVSNSIVKSLSLAVTSMQKIGSGDLTVRSSIGSKDELGALSQSMNKMTEELGMLVRNTKEISNKVYIASDALAATAEEVNASTEEVAKAIEDVASGANDQAVDVEKSLQKTNELADNIQKVADGVDKVRESFKEANKLNADGIQIVKALNTKTELNNQSQHMVGEVVNEVDKRSSQIGSIIETIGQIAQQTNLLALNASIEAARAGEAGKGFAVVADEIRKLAEQSSGAAQTIGEIVEGIQKQSKIAVETMENAKLVGYEQSKSVIEAEGIFNKILNSVNNINSEILAIASSTKDMIGKKDEIIEAVENIAAASQQTSASTQEISASTEQQLAAIMEVARTAEELNGFAIKLNSEIEKFKI